MSRKAATVTQSDIARAIRAAKQTGARSRQYHAETCGPTPTEIAIRALDVRDDNAEK